MLMNITFNAKILNERGKSAYECRFNKIYFSVDEFEIGVNVCIFSGNEQQKVYS